MEATQNNQGNLCWYNCPPVDNLIATGAPVHVEVDNLDIARSMNQQVQIQYGNFHTVEATTNNGIIVTESQHIQEKEHEGQITIHAESTSDNILQQKPKFRTPGERIPCLHCDKTFSCNANLRDHVRLHTGERPFVCSECGLAFAQRSNWRLHKRVHTGERPYMCGICGKTFSRSSHLPGHMRVHTREKPFSCVRCSNSFSSQQALRNHMRTHTGEKPFVCSYCETAFTHSSSLSSHKKRCTGHKRKRGRPLGSSRKLSTAKKKTGRSRGRGKRGRRPKVKPKIEDVDTFSEVFVDIKNEQFDSNSKEEFSKSTGLIPIDPDTGDPLDIPSENSPGIISNENINDDEILEKKLCEGIIIMTDDSTADVESENDVNIQNDENIAIQTHQVSSHSGSEVEKSGINQIICTAADIEKVNTKMMSENSVVYDGTAAIKDEISHSGIVDPNRQSNLHQEAAVAMAVLHQGGTVNMVPLQGTNVYVQQPTTTTNTWFTKSTY